ncbi:helix-turn-helix domain-containing protein [Nocardia sp. NPDC003482]
MFRHTNDEAFRGAVGMGGSKQVGEPESSRSTDPRMSAAGQELTAELQRLKNASGQSFATLAGRIPYGKSALERYINGKQFPPREAVHDLGKAFRVNPAPLLRLWDAADSARRPQPRIEQRLSKPDQPPLEPPRPTRISRVRILTVAGTASILVPIIALVLVRSVRAGQPSTNSTTTPPASSTDQQCRVYYAESQAVTSGVLCWKSKNIPGLSDKDLHVQGTVVNRPPSEPAVAQLCLSIKPNSCTQIIDLGHTVQGKSADAFDRELTLPAGNGAWIRVCVGPACSPWL